MGHLLWHTPAGSLVTVLVAVAVVAVVVWSAVMVAVTLVALALWRLSSALRGYRPGGNS